MAEYIEREALLKEAESRIMWGASAAAVYESIEDAPAADVSPVRHGRWVQCKYMLKTAECSECGLFYTRFTVHERYPNYCPKCGAKMDGGAD